MEAISGGCRTSFEPVSDMELYYFNEKTFFPRLHKERVLGYMKMQQQQRRCQCNQPTSRRKLRPYLMDFGRIHTVPNITFATILISCPKNNFIIICYFFKCNILILLQSVHK